MRQPNQASLYDTLAYIEEQALQGRFDGKGTALHVLRYFAQNSWRVIDNEEEAPLGTVLSGCSGINKVAKATGSSRRTVQRAVDWLVDNSWMKRKRMVGTGGRQDWNQYRLMLDYTGHTIREEMYEMAALREGVSMTRGGCQNDTPRHANMTHPKEELEQELEQQESESKHYRIWEN